MKSFQSKSPIISVIVPAYNEEKYIGKCLRSLKNQKFKLPYEIIVVNNNSQDNTAKVARKEGVKVVFERAKGISAARQRGFDAAKADIVAQTDADTTPDRYWLDEIYTVLSSNKDLIGVSGPSYSLNYKNDFRAKITRFVFDALAFKIAPIVLGNGTFRGHNVAFKKDALLKVGGYRKEVQYLDDADLNIRLRNVGKIIMNPKQVVFTSPRRTENEGTIRVLFYQIWCSIKLYFQKDPVITAKDYR